MEVYVDDMIINSMNDAEHAGIYEGRSKFFEDTA